MKQDYQLRTVSRTLELLTSLETAPGPLSLTEIAARLDESTPVVFRILKTLESHGFLLRQNEGKRYSLSMRGKGLSSARSLIAVLKALASAGEGLATEQLCGASSSTGATSDLLELMEHEDLVRKSNQDHWVLAPGLLNIARPLFEATLFSQIRSVIERLRDETKETIALFKTSGKRQTVVDVAPSRQPIRYVAEIGSTYPLHKGAAGKAALAGMSDKLLTEILTESEIAAEIGDLASFRDEIDEIRSSGYAISYGERVEGAAAVATWIGQIGGIPVGVMSVIGPAFRLDDATLMHMGKLLLAERDRLVVPPMFEVKIANAGRKSASNNVELAPG